MVDQSQSLFAIIREGVLAFLLCFEELKAYLSPPNTKLGAVGRKPMLFGQIRS